MSIYLKKALNNLFVIPSLGLYSVFIPLLGSTNFNINVNLKSFPFIKFISEQDETEIIGRGMYFSEEDCLEYLNCNFIKEGYQPIQVVIENNSDKAYIFDPKKMSNPCFYIMDISERSRDMFSSYEGEIFTISRMDVTWIRSELSNIKVFGRSSSSKKLAKEVIAPYSSISKLVFVKKSKASRKFMKVKLRDKETGVFKYVNLSKAPIY